MNLVKTIQDWHDIRQQLDHQSIGFVATMGCLHQGHQALIKQSLSHCTYTVVSIFVNPKQFNDVKDYQKYPKTTDQDLELCKKMGVDAVFMPTVQQMYPQDDQLVLDDLSHHSHPESIHRPGHFSGMLTVVAKLLSILRPNKAFFGEKDALQLALVQKLVTSLHFNCTIQAVPTIRDRYGLPLSSRHQRLSQQGLKAARRINDILRHAPSLAQAIDQLKALQLTIDYLVEEQNIRYCAVYCEGVRLIDHIHC
jgi:pantoate--beta-alanine ligase